MLQCIAMIQTLIRQIHVQNRSYIVAFICNKNNSPGNVFPDKMLGLIPQYFKLNSMCHHCYIYTDNTKPGLSPNQLIRTLPVSLIQPLYHIPLSSNSLSPDIIFLSSAAGLSVIFIYAGNNIYIYLSICNVGCQ